MENLKLYNAVRSVPQEAQKTIGAGKLKGFTDINPMWRIKKLTEIFGVCGFGWTVDIIERWTDTIGSQSFVSVKVALKVKLNGQWSEPIIGVGGSMLYGKGVGTDTISDEAWKMAYTDAISIACKALGFGADIYYAKDRTKYNMVEDSIQSASSQPQPQTRTDDDIIEQCTAALNRCSTQAGANTIWEAVKELQKSNPKAFVALKKELAIWKKNHSSAPVKSVAKKKSTTVSSQPEEFPAEYEFDPNNLPPYPEA